MYHSLHTEGTVKNNSLLLLTNLSNISKMFLNNCKAPLKDEEGKKIW